MTKANQQIEHPPCLFVSVLHPSCLLEFNGCECKKWIGLNLSNCFMDWLSSDDCFSGLQAFSKCGVHALTKYCKTIFKTSFCRLICFLSENLRGCNRIKHGWYYLATSTCGNVEPVVFRKSCYVMTTVNKWPGKRVSVALLRLNHIKFCSA